MTRASARLKSARPETSRSRGFSDAGKALKSRILPEPLATFPILAATPASDPQWSAIVAWAIFTLQRAELPAGPWTASGLGSIPVKAPELGLADDWQAHVVCAAGTYADIFARNLGERSRLKLPRGPNAPVEAGGLVRDALPGIGGQINADLVVCVLIQCSAKIEARRDGEVEGHGENQRGHLALSEAPRRRAAPARPSGRPVLGQEGRRRLVDA